MKKLSNYQIEIFDILWIAGISTLIRFHSLAPNSLWQDDSYVALVIKANSFEEFKFTASHHPGFSGILLSLYELFGFSEILFQAPSFILGILSPAVGYLALKRHNFSRNFSSIFGLMLASSPTLVLVSSRVKPYSTEAFIAVLYLYFLASEKKFKYDLYIFLFSLFALFISYYSIFVIGAYYLSIANYNKFKFRENQNLYFGFGIFVFFLFSYFFYLSSLPLISSITIHPHVFYDWPIIDVFKGIYGGFSSMAKATIVPIYLLKWTSSYGIFSDNPSIYQIFYSLVSLIAFIHVRKIFNSKQKLAIFIISPFVITVFGALLGHLVWGVGVPEQYRMLSSLIPCYALWILISTKEMITKFKIDKYIRFPIYFLFLIVSVFYIKFHPYFIYPQQDYRTAIELIKDDMKGVNYDWIIKTTDGTSPAAVLYDGSTNVEFGPGLIFSSSKSKSELVDLSGSEYQNIRIIYTIYINKDYDFSYLGFNKIKLDYPPLGNLFISKWKK